MTPEQVAAARQTLADLLAYIDEHGTGTSLRTRLLEIHCAQLSEALRGYLHCEPGSACVRCGQTRELLAQMP